eukprot:scaffold88329_cov33-Phaeocystis_antarctica.AAC.1
MNDCVMRGVLPTGRSRGRSVTPSRERTRTCYVRGNRVRPQPYMLEAAADPCASCRPRRDRPVRAGRGGRVSRGGGAAWAGGAACARHVPPREAGGPLRRE